MAREQMRPVDLVEDDDEDAFTGGEAEATDAPPAGPVDRRRRRRAAVAVAAVLVVVAAGAGTAQAVQDARERARYGAVAGQWGVVAPVRGPLEVMWTTDDADALLSRVMTSEATLVGVEPRSKGVLEVTALDARTGEERWRTPLLEIPAHPDPDVQARLREAAGMCQAHPEEPLVVCLATDARWDPVADPGTPVVPTTARVLLLDVRDGRVVEDLTEAAGSPLPDAVALVDDVVVTAGADEEAGHVRGLTLTGDRAWDVTLDAGSHRWAAVKAVGDVLVAATPREVVLLDSDGTEQARSPVDDSTWIALASSTSVALVRTRGDVLDEEDLWDATTTVLRASPLELDGNALQPSVDDGSVPGLTLTMTRDATLHAWDDGGAEVWSAKVRASSVLVLDGRVHLDIQGGAGRPAGRSLVTFDARTGEELWSSEEGADLLSDGRLLYREDLDVDDGEVTRVLVAVDPATGAEVWREPLAGCADGLSTAAGLMLCPTDDGTNTWGVLG